MPGRHHHAFRLDDARLFSGYQGEGIPEHVGVVIADGGDDADFRSGYVGSVQPSSQPRFQHLVVHGALLEMSQRQRRQQLKGGQFAVSTGLVDCLKLRFQPAHQPGKSFFGNRLSVYLNPFPDTQQVGRSVQSGTVAGLIQDGGDHGGGAALALGSGDMDCLGRVLRVTEPGQQHLDAPQVKDHPRARYPLVIGKA